MQLKSTVGFRFLLFIGICLWSLTAFGEVQIIGTAPDYPDARVLVYQDADPLSQKQMLIGTANTDSKGDFTISFEADKTAPVTLYINHVAGTMLVEPDKRYQVFFPPLQEEQVRSFSGTARVGLIFSDLPNNDVNRLISDLNYAVDSFLVANVAIIGSKAFPPKLELMEQKLRNRFESFDNEYILHHLDYTLATTEFSARAFTRRDLYERHLQNSTYPENPAFFDFLRTFFQRYFERFEANYGGDLIKNTLDLAEPGPELIGLLQKDEFLEDLELRELVAIQGLTEGFYTNLPRKKVISCLNHIAIAGSTDFNRRAAENTRAKLTATAVGFPAPDFKYSDQHNEAVSLSDFRGKHVYLEFTSTWCSDCKREQDLLPALLEEYGDVVEVVTIFTDSDPENYQQYLAKYPHYTWPLLFDETGFESRDLYNVRTLPTFFLINPEGRILQSPASSPTDGIVEHLYPILQKAQEEKRFKVGE